MRTPNLSALAYQLGRYVFSPRTLRLIHFDLVRLATRLKRLRKRDVEPGSDKLHLGCGRRVVRGWLNVAVAGSVYDVDLASGRLPWEAWIFRVVVSQHLLEHLELEEEAVPL